MSGNSRTPGRTVSAKLLAVLDAFTQRTGTGRAPDGGLRLSEIARRADLPAPTALRLVRELVAWGGLERFADGSYRLGTRLWAIGGTSPCPHRLRAVTREPLRDLATATGGRAEVAVLERGAALVLEGAGPGAGGGADRLPLHATALGKVLLAWGPPAPVGPTERFTAHTRPAGGPLERELRRIRQAGFALAKEEFRLGEVAAAVPLRTEEGRVVAALGVTVPSTVPLARVLPHLRRAAARTGVVGGPPGARNG
ncbi:IclR family transcriptional regulator C-terminal domain-containing protein [Streptomyces sp. NPDC088194]|uniref:IclR family transcriptional regulator n=1 Tax=Streptomyces sp. NPDC088194 TaxID=3154931 RepID=UPI00345048CD